MRTYVLLNSGDSVVTALTELDQGAGLTVEADTGPMELTIKDTIPYAHKIAIRSMAPGDPVTKYGEVIGIASQSISPGDWVHVHNVASARARGDIA